LLDGIVVDVRDVCNDVADMAKGSRMQIEPRSNKRGQEIILELRRQRPSRAADMYLQTARLGRARK
jgi:hypothetical protein